MPRLNQKILDSSESKVFRNYLFIEPILMGHTFYLLMIIHFRFVILDWSFSNYYFWFSIFIIWLIDIPRCWIWLEISWTLWKWRLSPALINDQCLQLWWRIYSTLLGRKDLRWVHIWRLFHWMMGIPWPFSLTRGSCKTRIPLDRY